MKKLVLTKETLLKLNDDHAGQAVGGYKTWSADPCASNNQGCTNTCWTVNPSCKCDPTTDTLNVCQLTQKVVCLF